MNLSAIFKSRAPIVALVSVSVALAGSSSAFAASPSGAAEEVIVASPVIEEAAPIEAQREAVAGNTVTVAPVDPTASAVTVTLPTSADAQVTSEEGLLALADDANSSIVPVVLDDGSVAIHSVLHNAAAPTAYDYKIDLPTGATLQIDADNGGAIAFNENGAPVLFVAAPWATDANGRGVDTYYTVEGGTLTQHVAVDAETAYPVVADPWLGVNLVAGWDWTWTSSGWKLNVNPTAWARGYTGNPNWIQVGYAGWDELANRMISSERARLNVSGQQQYVCHMGFAGFDPQWNMELWKPAKALVTQWIGSQCN